MSHLLTPERTTVAFISASIITAFTLGCLFSRQSKLPPKVILGPRAALPPVLAAAKEKALELPLDALPGGRSSALLVYEWGPEDGRKVLFVHGIATPCIGLGGIAHALVEKGCRVMLFDLWGRGYSDSCGDLHYDERLYSTQLFFVLASSPLSWTGASSGGFSLVGYSLGGGISAVVTSHFPELVKSLVLLAPAGLIRRPIVSFVNRLIYSTGLIADDTLLKLAMPARKKGNQSKGGASTITDVEGSATTEKGLGRTPLSKSRPEITGNQAVEWQAKNHSGFSYSFVSTLLYGPVYEQGPVWARLGLRKDKTLIIAGEADPVIVLSELKEDATFYIGDNKIEFKETQGTHDFPIVKGAVVASLISEFWDYTKQRVGLDQWGKMDAAKLAAEDDGDMMTEEEELDCYYNSNYSD